MATLFTWIALASIASGSVSERVVLLAPSGDASEAVVHQVAGELRAAGFTVVTYTHDTAPEPHELERMGVVPKLTDLICASERAVEAGV